MPQVHYPFIDVAVHPAVRARFAAGDAVVLFSQDMGDVLWANGEGARLFGHDAIYDMIEAGPQRSGVAFRQLAAAAAQLSTVGDKRGFMMRVTSGFRSTAVSAEVSLIVVGREETIMFSAPAASQRLDLSALLSGFDDPDTHMALLGPEGEVLAASGGYAHVGVMSDTTRALIAAVARSAEGLVKRPIPSGSGYLPAAIGRLADDLYLLFCVETSIGRMDAPESESQPAQFAANVAAVGSAVHSTSATTLAEARETVPETDSLDGVAETIDARAPAPAIGDVELPTVIVAEIEAPFGIGDASAADVEEGGAEADIEDLAVLDGASAEDDQPVSSEAEGVAEPSDDLAEPVPTAIDHGDPTELDADIAAASTEQQPEMGGYTAGPDAGVVEAPETGSSQEVAPGLVDVETTAAQLSSGADDHDQPTELDADIAEATSAPQSADAWAAPDHADPMELDADSAEASAEVEPSDAVQVEDNDASVEMGEVVAETTEEFGAVDDDRSRVPADNDVGPSADLDSPGQFDAVTEPEESAMASGDAAQAAAEPSYAGQAPDASPGERETEAQAPAAVSGHDDAMATHHVAETLDTVDTPQTVSVSPAEQAEPVSDVSAEESEQAWAGDGSSAEMPAASMLMEGLAAPTEPGPSEPAFRFDRSARPIRFVWKLDAGGVFAEVSEEFSRAVGPHAGDIVGQSFRDLAAILGLDPEGQIASLLDRRDTWSGRTVKWPVEGTDLVVPVDLAALPTYSRNREFDGFRGFGIIRVGDAENDPNANGLKIAASAAQAEEPAEAEEAAEHPPEAPTDEFRGEVPALDIVSNPLATFADKVIQLEERRNRAAREGLSPSEQAALKEIARQLEPFGKRPNEDILKTSSGLLQTEDTEYDNDGHIREALAQDGDSEVHATEEDTGAAPDEVEPSPSTIDEQTMQSLFEDLGNGPGLTPYAIDQVPMAILIHAGDRLIEMNAEFRRLTGYADIAGLDRAGGLDALITRHEGPDAGVYLVRADGTQVLVSARLQSVRYEGSSALMLALTPAVGTLAAAAAEPQVIGESEPVRRIAALQVEVEELRSILETATDGVIVLDTEGRIRSLNRSASALFNFDDAEILGKPFAMLFAHESQKSVQDYLAGLAGHGVASVLNDGREVIGREASGGFIPLFMTMGRMPGSNSYCAVIRDITQWKRSEEELRTAKRAAETANQHKSDFLARVSHEIRTPLNAIIGFADMIATEHFGPAGHPRYVEYASDIGRSGRHVLDIVNDLLDISKIEAGEMDLEFAAVGLNDCVSEAVSLVQPQANAQRVIIRTALSQAVPDVVADLRSIKQIALNILANAIRYTPSGGQIVVSTSYEPTGSVTLRIRDTGVGMSKAELEQAMRPFGQVAAGTRQRGDGTGLGLPLTKAMTEANRATFAIHSAPNEGTLVEISFPPQRVLAD